MENNYNEPRQDGNPHSEPYQQPYCEPEKPEKTGMAIASLVLGIISIVLSLTGYNIITGIIAIILGAIYMSKKQKTRRGMAIAGLVLGIVSIAVLIIFIVILVVFVVGMFAGDPLYSEMYNEILNGVY